MNLNLKDFELVKTLIDEIEHKKLPVDKDFYTGEERIAYKWHNRPKIRFKKLKIGHIAAIRRSGVVECSIEHPKGINMVMGKNKQFINVGR